jgi:hypothetical protein
MPIRVPEGLRRLDDEEFTEPAFRITAFEGERPRYAAELRQLLRHTALNHIQWVNVGRRTVSFRTVVK